jgi:hypothetical protein
MYRKELANSQNQLAAVLRSTSRTTEAEQAYRVASELSPGYFEPVDQLSKLLSRTGRADEAAPGEYPGAAAPGAIGANA